MGGPSGPPAGLAGLSPAARAAQGRALRPGAGALPPPSPSRPRGAAPPFAACSHPLPLPPPRPRSRKA